MLNLLSADTDRAINTFATDSTGTDLLEDVHLALEN
jgi:hypothetical protein